MRSSLFIRFLIVLTAVVLSFENLGFCQENIAKLFSKEGSVEGSISGKAGWKSLEVGEDLARGGRVRTLPAARAAVKFSSGYLVRLSENTTLKLEKREKKKKLSVVQGVLYLFSRQKKDFPEVETPQVSASIRGTEFVVEVSGDTTSVSVLDGSVYLANAQGDLTVGPGELGVTVAGKAPVKQIMVKPRDAVEWALYYPAVFSLSDFVEFEDGASSDELLAWNELKSGNVVTAKNLKGNTWRAAMARSLGFYIDGNSGRARSELGKVSAGHTASSYLYSASLALSSGQVELARVEIKKASGKLAASGAGNSNESFAQSIRALGALISIQKGEADLVVNEFPEIESPESISSSSALLVASYYFQSQKDLVTARKALVRAAELDPENSLILARLAEIALGFGDLEQAKSYAESAVRGAPHGSYPASVLGFVRLSQGDIASAEIEFDRAIDLEQGFALPHLGRGLALIKRGELESGREALSEAVVLEPTISLYRSYLGKAYYEGDNNEFAEREYSRAIELDKNDPTPYLYRSIQRLVDHRPIEALGDIEKSIDLNDSRAVYRSKLLLDQDHGTRSAGLGQIYSRLGFDELARREAIRSLNSDYLNYSAHFLLASQYRDSQLNSRSQVTENILGRLLSPVTFNSNAVNLGGDASFNEYTTLFERPLTRINGDIGYDSQDESIETRAEIVRANNDLGMTLGHSFEYRDGFRSNDFLRSHQLFTLGQYQLSRSSVLVWDGALTSQDNGDVLVNFDADSNDPDQSSEFDGALARLGFRTKIDENLTILGQVFYNYGDFDRRDRSLFGRVGFLDVEQGGASVLSEPFAFDGLVDQQLNFKQHLYRADLQAIYDSEILSIVSGVSGRIERVDAEESSVLGDTGSQDGIDFLVGTVLGSADKVDQDSHRAFVYTKWHLSDWLNLDLGLTYEHVSLSENAFSAPIVDSTHSEDQWSPKAGLVLDLSKKTAFRMAYSESLDRTGRGGIGTIEPTFVGGFNQVFDGARGSSQKIYAIGIDHKELELNSYFGISFSRIENDLSVPLVEGGLTIDRDSLLPSEVVRDSTIQAESESSLVSAYWYQLYSKRFASIVTYDYEKFEELSPLPEFRTNRAGMRLNYFDPSGVFAFSEATFRYQERAGALTPRTIEDFWVFDAGIGYEFDHRRGGIQLGFENLFDQDFNYSSIPDEDLVLPRFGASLKLSLNF